MECTLKKYRKDNERVKASYTDNYFVLTIDREECIHKSESTLINKELAPKIVENYKRFVETLDNIVEGNLQCGHCSEWFSKEKILKGELPVMIKNEKKVTHNLDEWIDLHRERHRANCYYECEHYEKQCNYIYDWSQSVLKTIDPIVTARSFINNLDELNVFLKSVMEKKDIIIRQSDKSYVHCDPNDFVIFSDYGSPYVVVKESTLNLEDYKHINSVINDICEDSIHTMTFSNNWSSVSTYTIDHGTWLERFTSHKKKVFHVDDSFYNSKEIGVMFSENSERFRSWLFKQQEKWFSRIVMNGTIYDPASKHYEERGPNITVSCDVCGKTIKVCIGWKENYDVCLGCASKYSKDNGRGDVESLYEVIQKDYQRKIQALFGEDKFSVIACKKAIMCFLSIGLFKKDDIVSKVPKDVLIMIGKMIWKERTSFNSKLNVEQTK